MKSNLTKYDYRVGIVCLIAVIVLGMSASVFAGPALTSFIPGTTIKSAEVNANFSELANNLPAVKFVRSTTSGIILTPVLQNILSITVTPRANGYVYLIANSNWGINRSASAGNYIIIYLTNTSQSTSANSIYPYLNTVAGETGFIFMPFSISAVYPVSNGVASTFYLTGTRDSTGLNTIYVNNASGDTSITAIFFPSLLP